MKSTKLIGILTRYNDPAISTSREFFKRHNMTQLEERVTFGYAMDFGATRLLEHMLLVQFGLNGRKFIRFYEGIFRGRQVPHYEDAIAVVTVILAALATIGAYLSPIIGVEYANWKKKAEKDKQSFSTEHHRELLSLFKYLIKAFAVREAYYFAKISRKEFIELKKVARDLTLELMSNKHSKETVARFEKIWNDFDSKTNFRFDTQLLEELEMLAVEKIRRSRMAHPKFKGLRQGNFVTLEGIGVSPGQAQGFIKVVNSHDDIRKVSQGDIAVFQYFNPDMVPAIRKCAASIGLPRCGGRTGHLAIVCRELGMPCVVRVEDAPFKDEVEAIVNGSTGQVKLWSITQKEING